MLQPWSTEEVHELVDNRIQSIIDRSGGSEYEVFLTGPGNFRFDIATIAPYKGQRQGDKPPHWATVGERLKSHWGAKEVSGIEADDALAIRATSDGGNYIIASRDKDLRQVPCSHYSWKCGDNQPEIPTYTFENLGEVYYRQNSSGGYDLKGCGPLFFYAQLLTGDNIDNIKGCKGVGAKTAVAILNGLTSEEEALKQCIYQYQKKYANWKEVLEENARLLYLIRDPEWYEVEDKGGNCFNYKVNKFWEIPSNILESINDS